MVRYRHCCEKYKQDIFQEGSWQPIQSRAINSCPSDMSSTPERPLSILSLILHLLSHRLSNLLFRVVARSFPCMILQPHMLLICHFNSRPHQMPVLSRRSKNMNQDHKAQHSEESLIKFTFSFQEPL